MRRRVVYPTLLPYIHIHPSLHTLPLHGTPSTPVIALAQRPRRVRAARARTPAHNGTGAPRKNSYMAGRSRSLRVRARRLRTYEPGKTFVRKTGGSSYRRYRYIYFVLPSFHPILPQTLPPLEIPRRRRIRFPGLCPSRWFFAPVENPIDPTLFQKRIRHPARSNETLGSFYGVPTR